MLIHRQNSYATRSKRRIGRRETQSHGTGLQSKNPPCIMGGAVNLLLIYPYVMLIN
jgi:hypothetical protein